MGEKRELERKVAELQAALQKERRVSKKKRKENRLIMCQDVCASLPFIIPAPLNAS